jgi:GAF domain-containing protein
MKVAAKTDVGWVREHNEDSLHVDEHLALLIVADGIGGHKGGEVASAVAVQVITTVVKAMLPTATDAAQISQLMRMGICNAHEEKGEPVHDDTTLFVPLLHQAEMVGFICVDRELAEGSFLLEDVEFLGLLARLAMPQTSGETPGGHRVPHAREADEVLE